MISKGKALEDLIDRANNNYMTRGIAYCDKVETSTAKKTVQDSKGKKSLKVVAFQAAPRVDYSGFLYAGDSFHFDCKETKDEKGLPLRGIRDNQVDFLRIAVAYNTTCFIVVYSSTFNTYYRIDGREVLDRWNLWKNFPGRRNINRITYMSMTRIRPREGIALDYLQGFYMPGWPRAQLDDYTLGRYLDRKK